MTVRVGSTSAPSATLASAPHAVTLPELLEAAVEQNPDGLALVHANAVETLSTMDYFELDEHSTRIARLLIDKGVGPEDRVALAITRSVESVLAVWAIGREWRMAFAVQRMADELAAADRLPVDDLPRSPGGRIDRAAATEAFATARAEAEADPQDWAVWYRLAFAYDAAGDRRRAREALRTAARLHRG